jgi:non-ribosomal peptide synthetase component E (peptide arylation enzyme)
MTAEYIAFHAAERPDAIALINNGREITYAEFSQDIRKFRRALREFGLQRGARVLIDCDDVYFNWLLRISFEQLCVVTAALDLPESPSSSKRTFIG